MERRIRNKRQEQISGSQRTNEEQLTVGEEQCLGDSAASGSEDRLEHAVRVWKEVEEYEYER